jgi:hypothetical protein
MGSLLSGDGGCRDGGGGKADGGEGRSGFRCVLGSRCRPPSTVTPAVEDPVAHTQDLRRERCVLFVACTRARDHLFVSYTGQPSPFLPG